MLENEQENNDENDNDPSVPTDLLELHLELEDAGVTSEAFKEVYGK